MSSMRARTTIPFYVRRTSILTYRAACVWSQAVKARLDIILFFWFHSVSCTCDPCVLAEWVSERESILHMSDIRKTHDRTPRCVRTIDSVITRIYSIYMVLPTVFWSSIASTSLRVAYTRFFLQLNILVYFIQPIAALFSRLRKPNQNVFCFAVDCVMVTNRYSFSIEFFDECSLKLFHQSSRKMAPPNERRAIINVFSNHSHNVGRSVIRKHWRRFGCGEKTRTISLNKLLDFNCHNQCTVWHEKFSDRSTFVHNCDAKIECNRKMCTTRRRFDWPPRNVHRKPFVRTLTPSSIALKIFIVFLFCWLYEFKFISAAIDSWHKENTKKKKNETEELMKNRY